jgi:hypothetical protein
MMTISSATSVWQLNSGESQVNPTTSIYLYSVRQKIYELVRKGLGVSLHCEIGNKKMPISARRRNALKPKSADVVLSALDLIEIFDPKGLSDLIC